MKKNVKDLYGQYQVSTISAEEAMVRLHEKVIERIEKIMEFNAEIKNFPAKELAKQPEKFNLLINKRGEEIDLVIDSIDAIKNLISGETPKELREQLFETYNFIKLKFLKAILKESKEDFLDVKEAMKTLLDGWKKTLLSESK